MSSPDPKRRLTVWEERRRLLLGQMPQAHTEFRTSGVFGGPSLHFHLRALEAGEAGDFELFSEMLYALLVSWGMHRMGQPGPKMLPFEDFSASLALVRPSLEPLKVLAPSDLTDAHWEALGDVFLELRVMRTSPSLVATSKVLAHWLPRLVAPIDREYTLKFLPVRYRQKASRKDEAGIFRQLHQEFFHPILEDADFQDFDSACRHPSSAHPWDSSPLKLIDNLLIGTVRLANQPD